MEKLVSINPADNTVNGEVIISSEREVIDKCNQARMAKFKWKAYGIAKRVAILRPIINAFKELENELIELTIKEMGKTFAEAQSDLKWDFDYLQEFLDKGPQYIEDEITFVNGSALHKIVYEPRGVVACIVPWNFPFANFIWSVIPNLIVGNTVVFKHSEYCPLIGKLIDNVMNNLRDLPSGVFNQVYGDGRIGNILANQDIDMIWFTGSSSVGKKLFEIAGKKQIKAVLEMGGSNPAIVFDDIDIKKVVQLVYKGRFTNCGQVCDAIKRLIVHKNVYEDFIQNLAQHIALLNIGDPKEKTTQLGPLANLQQLHILESQVQDAINQGATIIACRDKISYKKGAYYSPALITNVDREMRIWKEEVFGPVLPIVTFDSEEEAIELANDSVYGLGASVYSKDLKRARRIANQLDVGFVDINDGNHWQACNPFGGYKASGMGVEHGRHGFQELCQIKVIAEE